MVIDRVVIMEEIQHGERILEHAVKSLTQGGTRQRVTTAKSVGLKWVYQFDPVTTRAVRL
ncbi:MAG: hypothetical protein AAF823_02520 [Planctomycetota bacterium]